MSSQTSHSGLANHKQSVGFRANISNELLLVELADNNRPLWFTSVSKILSLDFQPVAGHVSAAAVAVSPNTLRCVKWFNHRLLLALAAGRDTLACRTPTHVQTAAAHKHLMRTNTRRASVSSRSLTNIRLSYTMEICPRWLQSVNTAL